MIRTSKTVCFFVLMYPAKEKDYSGVLPEYYDNNIK